MDYQKQAQDFLNKTDTTLKVEFKKYDFYFPGDKDKRDIYDITMQRGSREYTFTFGNSLNDSGFYWSFATSKNKNIIDRKHLKRKGIINFIRYNFQPDFMRCKNDILHYPKEPTAYDILAGLTKYDCGTFEKFCAEYGYDEDSRTAERIYKAVKDEFNNIKMLFSDKEIELLQDIN